MMHHHRLAYCTLLAAFCVTPLARAGVTVTPIPVTPTPGPGATPTTPEPGAPSSDVPTTADEAKSLYDAGKYLDALKVIAHLLDIRGPAANFNRQDVLILRAECQLEIHETASAMGSLYTAQTEAQNMGLTDDAMTAQALRFLVQKSTNYLYTPITGTDHRPINILDRDKRKSAFDALFNDNLAVVKQRLQSATSNQILPPLVDVATDLPSLRAVEHISAQGSTATDGIAKLSATQASKIVYSALSSWESKITTISNAANRLIPDNVTSNTFGTTYHRQGLASEDIDTLHEVQNGCNKIQPMLEVFAKSFNAVDTLQPVNARTAAVLQKASTMLKANYRMP